ncbi:MAG: CoB--CoM heterodisulfide reductase iron-sulfur subunit A family protein [Candidatus Coatesbacteria bacterium]|nr:CoB--CoM heterodisulfide reductase iron-sulfur subunit A family protein [Candidatus Coatesbacteria bacterium]
MEETRIGVFVCKCGTNIAGFLDVSDIAEYSSTLPDVVFTKVNLFTCSEAGISEIKNAIVQHNLNRVVVSACTPRTHEPTFRAACQEAGLNPFLFEFVNIREHVSWVHKNDREKGTKKARDLIRMGVARAALLEPKEFIEVPVLNEAIIIGGGVAGLSSAVSLAKRGFKVHLVERSNKLGGRLLDLNIIQPEMTSAKGIIEDILHEAENLPLINIYKGYKPVDLKGCIGAYKMIVENSKKETKEIDSGVIILASGTRMLDPSPYYGYNGRNIITQYELEKLLSNEDLEINNNVVMIQCVGSRNSENVFCGKICCMEAIKNSILLKERDDRIDVYIIYRDIQALGHENERLLRKAKNLGVRFIHYSAEKPPEVTKDAVKIYSDILNREFNIPYSLAVLATPQIPHSDAQELSRILKVPTDENNFFLEAHMKLRPIDFATDGIFICGSARWPCTVNEAIYQAEACAARASIPLGNGKVKVEPINSLLDEDICRGCGLCVSLCPYKAIELVNTDKGKKAKIIIAACKGCGVCGSTCYRHAITMSHYKDEQLLAQIEACFKE